MKYEGFSYTLGQQGGIGYPPIVVKIRGRWYYIEGSRNHGGSYCRACGGECKITNSIERKEDTERRFFNRGKNKLLSQLPTITVEEFLESLKEKQEEDCITKGES